MARCALQWNILTQAGWIGNSSKQMASITQVHHSSCLTMNLLFSWFGTSCVNSKEIDEKSKSSLCSLCCQFKRDVLFILPDCSYHSVNLIVSEKWPKWGYHYITMLIIQQVSLTSNFCASDSACSFTLHSVGIKQGCSIHALLKLSYPSTLEISLTSVTWQRVICRSRSINLIRVNYDSR